MKQITILSAAYAKGVHAALRLLLVAVLALSGLLFAASARADESSGQEATGEGAAATALSEAEPGGIAPLASALEPSATGDIVGWIKTYGGSGEDTFESLTLTPDGGFVAVGQSLSSEDDLPGNKGAADAVIAKFDVNGNRLWIKNYGGSGGDSFSSVIATSDGGFVAVGWSESSDGDLPGNKGADDFVIAKFDTNGNKLWFKSYGGSGKDLFSSAALTPDGGFVAAGSSLSSDGDLTGSSSGSDGSSGDAVIARFDASGNKVWLKSYGGSGDDNFSSVVLALDGGFVAVGHSFSSDGDFLGNKGWNDTILAKFDTNGDKAWFRTYEESCIFVSVITTPDGGFVAAGISTSIEGDLSNNKGASDAVIARFDTSGNRLWLKNYGGSSHDLLSSVALTPDGGFVATGVSLSTDGDLSNSKGSGDAIIAKFGANGNKVWFRSYGGSGDDSFSSVAPASDGGFFAAGFSESSDGDLPGNKGDRDFVIAKFDAEGRLVDDGVTQHEGLGRQETAARASAKAYPDPAQVDNVILAYSYDFPDALAASYLAGALDAPILLCDTNEIPEATASELARLSPDSVYLVGGIGVISEGVEDVLHATSGVSTVTRLGGAGREETAYLIANEARDKGGAPTTAFVANAADFPDALTAGSLSASQGVPILLTVTGSLDGWASLFLTENSIADVIIVGGAGSVSEGVAAQLRALPHAPSVTRWSGAGRYETSADVLNKAIAKWSLTPTVIGLASGDGFPDALVGGAAVGNRGGLLAITSPDKLSAAAEGLISTYKDSISGVEIFGGTGTIRVAPEVRRLLA